MEIKIGTTADDLHSLLQPGPFYAKVRVRYGAVFSEGAHGTEDPGELMAVGGLQELGVKGYVMANSQVGLPAKRRDILVFWEMQGIVISCAFPPF